MTDDAVPTKLAIVRENLEKLERIPQASWQEFDADFRNLDSALHRLQPTIQALIDIACYLVALRGLGVPRTSMDALESWKRPRCCPRGPHSVSLRSWAFAIASCTSTIASILRLCTPS